MDARIIGRHALDLVLRAMESFRVVVLNGPRQAGKSTLVELLHHDVGGTRITLAPRAIVVVKS